VQISQLCTFRPLIALLARPLLSDGLLFSPSSDSKDGGAGVSTRGGDCDRIGGGGGGGGGCEGGEGTY
jgi:hypothetical protein